MPSRARAAALIEQHQVLVSGAVAEKASRLVAPTEPIELRRPPRFVSRGGEKLAAALDRFGLDVTGLRCLDAGASTGGFTDCLLQRGAAQVVAVDVGEGLLDPKLRGDARVEVLEGLNARHLGLDHVGRPVDFAAADLSFISLLTVAPALRSVAAPQADLVVLVKPQFEAGPERVGRGGVVRDEAVHRDVLRTIVAGLGEQGMGARAVMPSPLRGPAGNVEFLAHLVAGGADRITDAAVDAAVAEAHAGGPS